MSMSNLADGVVLFLSETGEMRTEPAQRGALDAAVRSPRLVGDRELISTVVREYKQAAKRGTRRTPTRLLRDRFTWKQPPVQPDGRRPRAARALGLARHRAVLRQVRARAGRGQVAGGAPAARRRVRRAASRAASCAPRCAPSRRSSPKRRHLNMAAGWTREWCYCSVVAKLNTAIHGACQMAAPQTHLSQACCIRVDLATLKIVPCS